MATGDDALNIVDRCLAFAKPQHTTQPANVEGWARDRAGGAKLDLAAAIGEETRNKRLGRPGRSRRGNPACGCGGNSRQRSEKGRHIQHVRVETAINAWTGTKRQGEPSRHRAVRELGDDIVERQTPGVESSLASLERERY